MSYNYDAKGRFYRYDALGRAIASGAAASGGSANSKNWQLTLYSYDNQGRLISKEIHTQDKPELETVMDYTYNHLGEVTKQHLQVGSQHLYHFYAYNHLGQLANVYTNTTDALPATPEVTYAYNESGQLVSEDIQGQTKADLNYRYDLKGRLDQLNNGDNSFTEDLSYNPDGTIASTAFTNGGISYSYSYRYDDRGRLTEADYSEGTTKFDVSGLSYDAHGDLKTLNRWYTGESGLIDSLSYSHITGTNKLASVTDGAVPAATTDTTGLVIYDESLHVPWINASWGATVTFGSAEQASAGATSIRVDQDAWGGLSVHHGNWGASQDLDPADYEMLSFDIYGSGNELILDVRLENDAGQSFPRISLGTITPGQWTRVEVAMSELNPNGYLFHRIDILESSGAPLTYYVDEWGLLDIRQAMVAVDWDAEDASFSWDASGNMKSNSGRGITDISYDSRNLPLGMSLSNGLEAFYRYNSAGWRIHKRVEDNGTPSVNEHYIMDDGTLLAVTDSVGNIKHWNLYGNGLIGRQESSGTKKYYLTDHLGSTRQVIDDTGTLLEYYDYYPFGLVLRSNVAGQQTKETFTGKENDPATGYYYFGARYYDAALGSWGATDPAGQFASPYVYAGNSPVLYVDEDGEFGILTAILIGAAIGGGFGAYRATQNDNISIAGGIWRGALVGAVGGALGGIGVGSSFAANLGMGIGQGALTGTLDAALFGGDIARSALTGGITGGVFTTLTSPQLKNALKGEGFRSNQKVFADFVEAGDYQGALDYFGFEGTYQPDVDIPDYVQTESGSYFGRTSAKNGQIYFGSEAFTSYDNLYSTYVKESYHRAKWLQGIPFEYQEVPEGLPRFYRVFPEERLGFIHAYKNQGLFPNSTINHFSQIQFYQIGSFDLPLNQHFLSKWWHFIYKIPRRF